MVSKIVGTWLVVALLVYVASVCHFVGARLVVYWTVYTRLVAASQDRATTGDGAWLVCFILGMICPDGTSENCRVNAGTLPGGGVLKGFGSA